MFVFSFLLSFCFQWICKIIHFYSLRWCIYYDGAEWWTDRGPGWDGWVQFLVLSWTNGVNLGVFLTFLHLSLPLYKMRIIHVPSLNETLIMKDWKLLLIYNKVLEYSMYFTLSLLSFFHSKVLFSKLFSPYGSLFSNILSQVALLVIKTLKY